MTYLNIVHRIQSVGCYHTALAEHALEETVEAAVEGVRVWTQFATRGTRRLWRGVGQFWMGIG
jgi:hypothetical protein